MADFSKESLLNSLISKAKKQKRKSASPDTSTVVLAPQVTLPTQSIYIRQWDPKDPFVLPKNTAEITSESALDQVVALHYQCFHVTKDKLPRSFIEDVVNRQTGILLVAYVDSSLVPSSGSSSPDTPAGCGVTVVGASLLLHLTFWSKFKDTEFQLRKIENIFSLFVDGRCRGNGIGSRLLDAIAGTSHSLCQMHVRGPDGCIFLNYFEYSSLWLH
jgi:ribosomal protein S18 acetylase RimI-like enzyme